jgi:RNA-directed DNA polymerase
MKDRFLNIQDHRDLAEFFGMTFKELTAIVYPKSPGSRYRSFRIPKRTGGYRRIQAPNFELKSLQTKLQTVLNEIYRPKGSAHGFLHKKSIVSNAKEHVKKDFLFNLDLEDFFGTIHFGRVKGLFKAEPFGFGGNVATILAHICCEENVLPQGAPTSPVISNMICRTLDGQLELLARKHQATYTRYADDLTFSFTRPEYRLPRTIVVPELGLPGEILKGIIDANGFRINQKKVRLVGSGQRMEATGLTVNEFPNVRRQYIRQVRSMLYAWKKHTYEKAEEEHLLKYDTKPVKRSDDQPFRRIVQGKIASLKSVLGDQNEIYRKIAEQYNNLVPKLHQIELPAKTQPVEPMAALWVTAVLGLI